MDPKRNYSLLEVNGHVRLVDARLLRLGGPLVGRALAISEIPWVERRLIVIRKVYLRIKAAALRIPPFFSGLLKRVWQFLRKNFHGRPGEKPGLMGLLMLCAFGAELGVMSLHGYLQVPDFPFLETARFEERTRLDMALIREIGALYDSGMGLNDGRTLLVPPTAAFIETEACYSLRPSALLRVRWPAVKLKVTAAVRRSVSPDLARMPVDTLAFHPLDKESILKAANERLGPVLATVMAAPIPPTSVTAEAESTEERPALELAEARPVKREHSPVNGRLSALFESGDLGVFAIGYDPKGGTSYGKYQFSSRQGSMDMFLEYLDAHAPRWAERLRRAGKPNSGYPGGPMARQWKMIASESPNRFEYLQDLFVHENYYLPALKEIMDRTGVDLSLSHGALREVLWSTAVQHGPSGGADIFIRAARKVRGKDSLLFEKAMVEEIFHERELKIDLMPRNVKPAVSRRLKQEKSMVLAMLTGPELPLSHNL